MKLKVILKHYFITLIRILPFIAAGYCLGYAVKGHSESCIHPAALEGCETVAYTVHEHLIGCEDSLRTCEDMFDRCKNLFSKLYGK